LLFVLEVVRRLADPMHQASIRIGDASFTVADRFH
jgi:hypothetical protein